MDQFELGCWIRTPARISRKEHQRHCSFCAAKVVLDTKDEVEGDRGCELASHLQLIADRSDQVTRDTNLASRAIMENLGFELIYHYDVRTDEKKVGDHRRAIKYILYL